MSGVEVVISNKIEVHDRNVNSVLFFEDRQKIVTCSSDNTVRIFSISEKNTIDCDKIIRFKGRTNHLIKWKNSFLVSTDDNRIVCHSVTSGERLKKFGMNKSEVLRLLKIDEDLFLSCNFEDELFVISYSKNKIESILGKERLNRRSKLLLSLTNPDQFFVNTDDEHNTVKLINHRKDKVVQNHCVPDDEIFSIDTFINREKEEILVCGTKKGCLYFFTTSIRKRDLSGSLRGRSVFEAIKKIKIRSGVPILSMLCVKNDEKDSSSYLFAESGGYVYLIDIKSDLESNTRKVICRKKIHQKPIRDMFSVEHETGRFLLLFTCSEDHSVKITHFTLLSDEERVRIRDKLNESIMSLLKSSSYLKRLLKRELLENEFRNQIKRMVNNSISLVTGQKSINDLMKKVEKPEKEVFIHLFQNLLRTNECFHVISSSSTESEDKIWYFGQNKPSSPCFGIKLEKRFRMLYSEPFFYPMGYLGTFDERRLETGKGRVIKKDRETSQTLTLFEGFFKNGKKEGKGVEYTYFKGNNVGNGVVGANTNHKIRSIVFEGLYRNGERDGDGEYHDLKKGDVIRGLWRKGTLIKEDDSRFSCPVIQYDRISKYLKNRKMIGSGAFGVVYSFKTSNLPSSFVKSVGVKSMPDTVALKIMKVHSDVQRELLFRMIKRGVGLCSSIRSENILRVYGIILGFREVGYIMEICKLTISQLVRSVSSEEVKEDGDDEEVGGFKMEEKLRILLSTAKGMKCLHDKSIMHRDLKWANVMIDFDSVIKITDFDTLKEDEQKWRMKTMDATSRIGTTGFLAPEVFLGKSYSLSCDVYAFGLMIYCLLSGLNQPFLSLEECSGCGTSIKNIFISNSLDYHVANCQLRPSLSSLEGEEKPSFLVHIMEQCWSSDPSERPTFETIVKILEEEREKKMKKNQICYTLISFRFVNRSTTTMTAHKMILMDPKLRRIYDWVEKKYKVKVEKIMFGEDDVMIGSDEELVDVVMKKNRYQNCIELKIEISELQENNNSNGHEELYDKFQQEKSTSILVDENRKLRVMNKILMKQCKDMKSKYEEVIKKQDEEINKLKLFYYYERDDEEDDDDEEEDEGEIT